MDRGRRTALAIRRNVLWLLCAGAAIAAAASAAAPDLITDFTQVYADAESGRVEREPPRGLHGLLGAGLIDGQRPIGEQGRRAGLLPLVVLRYDDWAWWTIAAGGVWLAQSEDRSLRFGVGARLHGGWRPDDDPLLAGMDRRRGSLDGSVDLSWRTRALNLRVAYYADLGDVSNGESATLGVSHAFRLGERSALIPSFALTRESSPEVDYYYGVRPAEVTSFRPAYSGRAAVNSRAGLTAARLVDRSWVLLGGVYAVRYGPGIAQSPIVTHRTVNALHVGAAWRF